MAPKSLSASDFGAVEIVVVAHITSYTAVINPKATQAAREIYAKIPELQGRARDKQVIDHAKIGVEIEDVLKGAVPPDAGIYWTPGTRSVRERLASGRYVIGLKKNDKAAFPANSMLVVEKACAGAFITDYSSVMGEKVRQLFAD